MDQAQDGMWTTAELGAGYVGFTSITSLDFVDVLSIFHSKTLGGKHMHKLMPELSFERGGGGTVGKCLSREDSD